MTARKTLDPRWLDAQYNNRALVPDHVMHLTRWADASDDARQAHPFVRDVAYGKGLNESLDVLPAAAPKAPVMVFLHGGYWRALDKSDHSFIAPAFKNQGVCVVVPNYALCPAVTIPEIVMQMVKALSWTHRHIADFGGDPQRISVVGHSAGGHLAAQLMACQWGAYDRRLPADLVKGAMGISGLYDLEPLMHAPFLQESLRLTPEQVAMASPARLPAPKHGRLYCLVGAKESGEFQRHNGLMRAAWGPRRVPVVETVAERHHFDILEELSYPWTRTHQLALSLVQGPVQRR
jgi:arylformamidase